MESDGEAGCVALLGSSADILEPCVGNGGGTGMVRRTRKHSGLHAMYGCMLCVQAFQTVCLVLGRKGLSVRLPQWKQRSRPSSADTLELGSSFGGLGGEAGCAAPLASSARTSERGSVMAVALFPVG